MTTGVSGAAVASIAISPTSATLVTSTTKSFAAQPMDAAGQMVTGVSLAWSSSDTTVATVSQGGTVAALTPGTIQIAASAQGINGYATVTTILDPVASIVIVPAKPSLDAGSTLQLTDTLKDAEDHVLTGRSVSWSSDEISVATVANSGLVAGVKSGTAHITATSGAASASVTVTVRPRGHGVLLGLP
jgi:uncharacterized protein YjdB